jgi:hypothetical protein
MADITPPVVAADMDMAEGEEGEQGEDMDIRATVAVAIVANSLIIPIM